jgi:hypothetical protein
MFPHFLLNVGNNREYSVSEYAVGLWEYRGIFERMMSAPRIIVVDVNNVMEKVKTHKAIL